MSTSVGSREMSEFEGEFDLATIEVSLKAGIEWRMLDVPDISDDMDTSPTKSEMQAAIARMNADLEDHPEYAAPDNRRRDEQGNVFLNLKENPIAHEVFANPAMHEWRRSLVPTALALYPLQNPEKRNLPAKNNKEGNEFSETEIDEVSRSFFINALDAIGIRTRAKIMEEVIVRNTSPGEVAVWKALACGAAVPELDARRRIHDIDASTRIHIDMFDIDNRVLDFGEKLASEDGMIKVTDDFEIGEHDTFTRHEVNLIDTMIMSNTLVHEQGENSADVVDALGIFEYFPKPAAVEFLKNAYQLVKPGGVLIIANMLKSHPQLAFNERGIGWPKIHPRDEEELAEIIEAAGIELDDVSAMMAEDGIYAVFEIKKPMTEDQNT